MKYSKKNSGAYIVEGYVDFNKTRLIDADNVYYECVGIGEAKEKATEAGLDLVCFNAPDDKTLAFCKIVDFGKWKYSNEKKKKKQNKEHRKTTKELRFSLTIDTNDVNHKIKQAKDFLDEGYDVMLVMRLRGRQRMRFDDAEKKLDEIVTLCENGKEVGKRKAPNVISVRLSPDGEKDKKDKKDKQ